MSITSNTPETVTLVKEDTQNKNTFKVTLNLDNPTITTTTNGTVQLTSDNYINNVSLVTNVVPASQTKTVTITENGTTAITPDNNIPYLDSVIVNTEVPSGFIEQIASREQATAPYVPIIPSEHEIIEITSTQTNIIPDNYTFVNNVAIIKIPSTKTYTLYALSSYETTFLGLYSSDIGSFEVPKNSYRERRLYYGYVYIIKNSAEIRFKGKTENQFILIEMNGSSIQEDSFLLSRPLFTENFLSTYFPST